MSVTDVKAKAPKKASNKKITKAQEAAVKAALEAAEVEYVPLSDLVKSPLNVRTIPYSVDSVRGLADSIETLGLLQNLIVHTLADGKSGVAAGGRRLTALNLLAQEGRLRDGHTVMVKRVSDDIAALASVAENEQRAAMHPAEQIAGFRTLAEQGKTPAQIGDALGFSARHVQRMLKLANLAPSLMDRLAQDDLTVEQCQALCLEDDHDRQVEVFESVKVSWSGAPAHLIKRAITETELSVKNPRFTFIGREAYEAAGGYVREDLFSAEEGEGTADRALVDRLVQEKLESIAQDVQAREGWRWSLVRDERVMTWGDDREKYVLHDLPEAKFTEDETRNLDELYATLAATETYDDENQIQSLIEDIEAAAVHREWSDEAKVLCGVVVSLFQGQPCIQRGVCRVEDMTADETDGEPEEQGGSVTLLRTPDAADGISATLLTRMSSERTLAVQAALLEQPEKAVALMVWRLCTTVFAASPVYRQPFEISLTVSHSSLTENAPSGREGKAWLALMVEKERLAALLPEGWEQDFTTFFGLDGSLLTALMAFCTACSVNGVQTRNHGHTSSSTLDGLETAIGFHLRDWWHPTREGYFKGVKHEQIVASLKDADMADIACDAARMKKSDAAEFAEDRLKNSRWVPAWLKAPESAKAAGKDTTDTAIAA